MHNSKEELIELADLSSSVKTLENIDRERDNKVKKRNRVDLSPINSLTTEKKTGDIVSIFSIKSQQIYNSKIEEHNDTESQTISDLSDDVFITEKNGNTRSIDNKRSYKEKISRHLKDINKKIRNASNLNTSKTSHLELAMERTRRQNMDVDVDIDSLLRIKPVRVNNSALEKSIFFSTTCNEQPTKSVDDAVAGTEQPNVEKNGSSVLFYSLPEQVSFGMKLFEKEYYIVPDGKLVDLDKKIKEVSKYSEQDGFYVNPQPKIIKRHINIIEQRLLTIDDKNWFDSDGNLEFVKNPLIGKSIKSDILTDKKDVSFYKPGTIMEDCNEIVIMDENILELYLSQLLFAHHPLFSLEHVFVQKLNNLYEDYKRNTENNTLQKLKNQLDALRYVRINIERKDTRAETDSIRLLNVNKAIKKRREVYYEEAKKDRDNLKLILKTWKQIKHIRAQHAYSNTNVKLLIKKEKVDFATANAKHEKMFEETVQEILRENIKGREVNENDQNSSENENLDETSQLNHNIRSDENSVRQELTITFAHSFGAPGEPIIKLLLCTTNEITEEIQDNKEIMRRNAILSTTFSLRIMSNGIEVCKSKPVILNDNFSLEIKEAFSIQLRDVPKCLAIEIMERCKTTKKKVFQTEINIPTPNFSKKNSKLHKAAFQTNEIVHHKHTGVGSGINLQTVAENLGTNISVDESPALSTSGYLQYCITWEKISAPIRRDFNSLDGITDKNLAIDVDKLLEWKNHILPDPQDPRNVVFFEYMAGCEQDFSKRVQVHFRLNPYMENFNFCNISELNQNIRLKILQLRNENEIEFDGLVIPNRVKEIPFNILADFKRRKEAESDNLFEENVDDDDEDFEAQRKCGKQYLKQVHIKIFQRCKNSENNLTYDSIVDEKFLVYFELMVKTLFENLLNWFRWKPEISKQLYLKPRNLNKNKSNDNYHMTEQVVIIIKIMSGKNIPSRNKNTFHETGKQELGVPKFENNDNDVRPFIEISYENMTLRTDVGKGINPVWNETLALPLESQYTDYLNPSSLSGYISVNLYDESDVEVKKLGRKCYNWLGGVDISLSSVCNSSSIKGLFKVKLPQLLLGYETEVEKYKAKSPKVNNLQMSALHAYLHMEISVHPNIPKLTPNMTELPCGEMPYMQEHILKWNQEYNNNFPNRKFSALAIGTNAKTMCVTRYLKPLEPPQIKLEEFDVTPEQCMRIVSLIPYTECNQFYHNIWLTTNQLFKCMIGSISDHAVALTCYLLALKLDAWLLFGYGIPHGSTTYVLVREYPTDNDIPAYYIYDVFSNEKHSINDTYCPLQRIYCLVNGENLWANIQRDDSASLMRFDLSRRSDWLALFNNDNTQIHFINNSVIYKSNKNTEPLELQIERSIRKRVTKIRHLDRTIWNHKLADVFKHALKELEINCMYHKSHFETVSELNEKLSSYKVTGYVINTAFTSISAIIKKIISLGVHIQDDTYKEFTLAVYIQSYPGELLSVWIFIGTVQRRGL